MGDSWLLGKTDASSPGESTTDLIENSTPPLVVISSRVKSPGELREWGEERRGGSRGGFEGGGLTVMHGFSLPPTPRDSFW